MNVQAILTPAYRSFAMMPLLEHPQSVGSVVLRHLKTPADIESVLELRDEIDLSVHASVSSNFASLEKKETSWVLYSLSSRAATS